MKVIDLNKRKNDLKELREDVLNCYKQMLPNLIKRHQCIDSDEVRYEVMKVMNILIRPSFHQSLIP